MFSKTLVINLILASLILLGTWYTWLQLTRPANPFTTGHQPCGMMSNLNKSEEQVIRRYQP